MYTGSPAPYVLSPLETPEPHGPPHRTPVQPQAPHSPVPPTCCRAALRPTRGCRPRAARAAAPGPAGPRASACGPPAAAALVPGQGRVRGCSAPPEAEGRGEGVRWMWGHLGGSGVTHLPAGAGRAIARPRELPDAGADSAAAAARTQLLLPQLHPAQRAHREALGQGGECESVGDVWGRGCGTEMVRGKGAGGWCGAAPAPQQSPDPSLPQSVQPRALGADPTDGRG